MPILSWVEAFRLVLFFRCWGVGSGRSIKLVGDYFCELGLEGGDGFFGGADGVDEFADFLSVCHPVGLGVG